MSIPLTPMTLHDWFDPYDQTHISAYRHLEKTGWWPEGFIPDTVEVRGDGMWHVEIVGKMARAWLDAMDDGHIKYWMKHKA